MVAQAQASAEATAQASAVASIDELVAQIRGSDEIPDELASDLDDLKSAVESGEEPASLLARLGAIAEKAKPFAELSSSLAPLAAQLLG